MWNEQQSIAIMNMNLQDIQQDIHRLATQQSQMQAQHLQAQQLMQAQQIANMLNQVIHPPTTSPTKCLYLIAAAAHINDGCGMLIVLCCPWLAL